MGFPHTTCDQVGVTPTNLALRATFTVHSEREGERERGREGERERGREREGGREGGRERERANL